MITPAQYTLSGNIDKHYALKIILRYSCQLVNSCMIVSYLDSSINKKQLATVNKLLELKYYAKSITERIKNNLLIVC